MTRRKRMLDQLDEDIREHLERETRDNIDRGMPPEEARRAALRKFGNVTRVKEQTHEVWSVLWLEQLLQDIRYGTRALLRSPSLTIAAILAIALGVGINVGIFSVLNGLALRLLPIPRANEVLSINQVLHFKGQGNRFVHNNEGYFSWSEYRNYRDHNQVFSGLAAYEPYVEAMLAGGNAQQLLGALASCNYFEVLEQHPSLGRGFVAADCAHSGGSAVAVLSDTLWRTQFGADPGLVGKPIVLNRTPFTVIGIAPAGFAGTEPVPSAFWVPITMTNAFEPEQHRLENDNMSWLAMLGRTRSATTLPQIRADLEVIAQRMDQQNPGRTTSLVVQAARYFSSPAERSMLIPVSSVVLGAFGLVLLIACANVTNLLLARASTRQKEIALRLSLGASRGRLIRQLLTESLLLSLTGGLLGSIVACWSFIHLTRLVTSHLPSDLPPVVLNTTPDLHVLAYALFLAMFTGVAFGLVPALQSTRPELNSSIQSDGAFAAGGKKSGRFLLRALVGSQVAVCMLLLLAAGLILRGLWAAQTVDPGFAMQGIATTCLDLSKQGYNQPRAQQFMTRFIDRLRGLPGVTEVAQAEVAPLAHDFSGDHFTLPGSAEPVPMEYNHVTPSFFPLTGIAIVRGRNFTSTETHASPGVIITESTARRVWPGKDPIGQALQDSQHGQHIVIGIARDAQVSHLGESTSNYLYYPFDPQDDSRSYVLVRSSAPFTDVSKEMRAAVLSIDPNLSVGVTRLEEYLEVWRAPSRIVAGLSGALGLLALLLCSTGIYGVVSYSVNRSVREIGIRVAMGARKSQVFRHVLSQAMRPVLIGGAVGLVLCAFLSGVLSDLMFGVSGHDPIAFVVVPCFLLSVAVLATLIPARRATNVDPAVALRYE